MRIQKATRRIAPKSAHGRKARTGFQSNINFSKSFIVFLQVEGVLPTEDESPCRFQLCTGEVLIKGYLKFND